MVYFLGVDAGGSHCRSRLIDENGTILGIGQTGPANARIGMAALFETLREAIDQAVRAAGLDQSALASTHAGMGIAGL